MIINVKSKNGGYDILMQRGSLAHLSDFLNLKRKVLIVTDDGVPKAYSQTVASQCKLPTVLTIKQGEKSKNLDTFELLLKTMVQNNFSRSDCVVAVGGGVVGDISGFAASAFMRGIDFYNIPTTVLSQVDSSIGGKTAIDFLGYKNLVGAFYPPKAVVIDTDTLKTLPQRQISNGLCESIKMAVTCDKTLFEIFENSVLSDRVLDDIIYRSILIKKSVVERDEQEQNLRKVLNFGHTLAHAVESLNQMDKYYHGECVAIGMVPMCKTNVRTRLLNVLKKYNLPFALEENADGLIEACRHDKKTFGDNITVVTVEEIGSFKFKDITFSEFENLVRSVALK